MWYNEEEFVHHLALLLYSSCVQAICLFLIPETFDYFIILISFAKVHQFVALEQIH